MACSGIEKQHFVHKKAVSQDELELRQRSKQIDAELKIERKRRQHQVRLLLLGAGESGNYF